MSGTTITILVALVVLIVVVALVIWVAVPMWSLRKSKKKAESLRATGKAGEATVLLLEDTGTQEKNNPRMKVLLEIRIPGYTPYKIEKIITIPKVRAAQIQEGSVVSVLADPSQPTNPDKVGILLR